MYNFTFLCQVNLQPYHSVFVQGGQGVVSVAGTGARLGVESMSAMTATPVTFNGSQNVECAKVAAGPDHTLFLMRNGSVRELSNSASFANAHKCKF